jgi:hypothetical protein
VPNGVRLLDYKSALRDDLPERYERQLQLYALLWQETRGEWPVEAVVIYPFTNTSYNVSIDPIVCQQVEGEARSIIARLQKALAAEQLATPGDVCQVCEFRPWCKPFWHWLASERSHLKALEQAIFGFEGEIINIEIIDYYWKLQVRWRNCLVRIVAPVERFPQLKNALVGMHLRALDIRLRGQPYQPQATVSDLSEIFLLQ